MAIGKQTCKSKDDVQSLNLLLLSILNSLQKVFSRFSSLCLSSKFNFFFIYFIFLTTYLLIFNYSLFCLGLYFFYSININIRVRWLNKPFVFLVAPHTIPITFLSNTAEKPGRAKKRNKKKLKSKFQLAIWKMPPVSWGCLNGPQLRPLFRHSSNFQVSHFLNIKR